VIRHNDVSFSLDGYGAEKSCGRELCAGIEIIPCGEGVTIGGGASGAGDEPVWEAGEGAALGGFVVIDLAVAPLEVGGLLLVADEAVVPGVGDGDFEVVGAGL